MIVINEESAAVIAKARVEQARKAAYADPYTGSDRHFAEATRLEGMGMPMEAETARMKGIVRFQEIQAAHPWP